ncbi:MAG: hypothetical protein ACT4P4_23470 [Betaproteobacteria bacterium]
MDPRLPKVLFGSDARYRLLRELYRAPDRGCRLRALAADAGVDVGQAHKLLRQFVDVGLCEAIPSSPYPTYRAARSEELQRALSSVFAATQPRAGVNPMQHIEARSLRLHEAAVERLRRDPKALRQARATVERWISRHGSDAPPALVEWREILRKPLPRIIEVALERTQYGDRIRKSSPLSTLVSRDERRKAYAPR